MTKTTRLCVAVTLLVAPTLVALAQISIEPPTPAATAPATSTVTVSPPAPATAPATTLPSAQSVLEGLLNEKPTLTTAAPPTAPAATNPSLTPAVDAVAPKETKTNRLREGQSISGTGRLIRDDKTGTYLFAFDADGKQMQDPPLTLLPSRYLMSMEEASDKGNRPTKFKISGEVTEYRGKNYLYVRYMLIVRDLNQGIGG